MMQQVLTAELGGDKRVFALQLGPVLTRSAISAGAGGPDWVTAGQVGDVAVAASAAAGAPGQALRLLTRAEADEALTSLTAAR
jgi:3-oxoacyl-[acyl-carrier protein] reductase